MQTFHSKVGYSLAYKKKELLCFVIACVVIAALIYFLFPAPAKGILAGAFTFLFLVFLLIGLLLMKLMLGVTTHVEGNSVRIHTAQAFTLSPKENELYFTPRAAGACLLTKKNIVSARMLKADEIEQLRKLWNVLVSAETNILQFLINTPTIQRLAFVTGWNNIVLLKVGEIGIWDPKLSDMTHMKPQKDYHMLVSVNNPDAFIKAIA
jgi:hypothetical protein